MAGKSKKIVQFLSTGSDLHIRREAKLLDQLFDDWGWETEIHFINNAKLDKQTRKMLHLNQQDRVLIHHDGSLFPEEVLQHPTDQVALILHDYVPAEHHHLYADSHKKQLIQAKKQLKAIISGAAVCIGHCEKAAGILERLGGARVREVPLLFDFDAVKTADDPYVATSFGSELKRVVVSGEIDAESGHDDLLKTFWYFKSFVNDKPDGWQLFSAGRYDHCEGSLLPMQLAIKHYEIPQDFMLMASELEESEWDTAMRHAALYTSYDRGDLDGVGLIQAIAGGVPVIAVAEGAGATVLGNSPLLFDEVVHSTIAESMSRLQVDEQWRRKTLASQRARLELFDPTTVAFTLKSILSRL